MIIMIIIFDYYYSDGRIDHVFVSSAVNVTSYRVNRGVRQNEHAFSNHFPVVVDVELSGSPFNRPAN